MLIMVIFYFALSSCHDECKLLTSKATKCSFVTQSANTVHC